MLSMVSNPLCWEREHGRQWHPVWRTQAAVVGGRECVAESARSSSVGGAVARALKAGVSLWT